MQIQVKSSNGITLVPLTSRLLAERKVFLEGSITQETACEFVHKIMFLAYEDKKHPIDVLINSPGGEITAGLLIYDVIQTSQTPIRTFCIGEAYSMAAILMACGKHGRYILPNSKMMLHEPLVGAPISGNSSSIHSISESLLKTKQMMKAILARHTGKTEEEIEKEMSFDHFYTAKEAVAAHLADKVITFDDIMDMEG